MLTPHATVRVFLFALLLAAFSLPCDVVAQSCGPGTRIDFGVTPDDFGGFGTFTPPGAPLDTQFVFGHGIVFGSAVDFAVPSTVLIDDPVCVGNTQRSSGSPTYTTDWWCQFRIGVLPGVPGNRATVETFSANLCQINTPPGATLMVAYDCSLVPIATAVNTGSPAEVLTVTAPGIAYVQVVSSADPGGLTIDCLAYDDPRPVFDLSDGRAIATDFETGPAHWIPVGGVWELGTPSLIGFLDHAFSGVNAWATDLDGFYPDSSNAWLQSPLYDCSGASADPILSFRMYWQTEQFFDFVRVEVNRFDGLGWNQLGVFGNPNWYDFGGVLDGGDGFSGGFPSRYEKVCHALDGCAGRPCVMVRIRFSSDASVVNPGAAVDDIRLASSCFGTESLHCEDLTQRINISGVAIEDSPAIAVTGQVVVIDSYSEAGFFDYEPLLVLAEVFVTGAPLPGPFPGICITGGPGSALILGGPVPPLNDILRLPPGGLAYAFAVPPGVSGLSLMTQAFVTGAFPITTNNIFASSDGRVIEFQ